MRWAFRQTICRYSHPIMKIISKNSPYKFKFEKYNIRLRFLCPELIFNIWLESRFVSAVNLSIASLTIWSAAIELVGSIVECTSLINVVIIVNEL